MKLVLVISASCAVAADGLSAVSGELTRRGLMGGLVGVANAADEMKTSADFSSFEALTGQSRSANLGPGTISGKSRPETGVILSGPPETVSDSIFADVVLNGGISARVAFTPSSSVKLAKGMYYDVEARSKQGDSSYLQVISNAAKSTDALVDAILQPQGRYGAFGPPTDVRVIKATDKMIDISFSAYAPGGSTTPRRAVVAVSKVDGSDDVLLLVSSAGEARWNAGGDAVAYQAAQSFRVDAVRQTKLAATKASDYRFEQQGGFRE